MTEKAKTAPRRVGGFTLVEVLIVVSLLSVVMLALGSALRTVAQTEERIDHRLARADEMRIAVAFIRSTLGRVSARKVARQPPAAPGVLFAAAPDAVAWIGVMPARYGAGGRYFFRLSVEADNSQSALVIRFAPWADTPGFPDWSTAESRVLVREVTRVAMAYQDSQLDPAWSTAWIAPDRLPDRFQLEVHTAAGPWPPLNLPMRVLPAGDTNSGGAVFGAS